jgi:phospholipid transport system substrate-binding protein
MLALALALPPSLSGAAAFAQPAPAPSATGTPDATVAQLDQALIGAMKLGNAGGFGGRAKLIAPAVEAAYDLPGILRTVVGLRWSALSTADQAKLMTAFRAFTVANYAANFSSYDGQTITVAPPDRTLGSSTIVHTVIQSGGDSNKIDYVLRQVDGSWKIEDVLLDGTISNVAVQRSDFQRTLASGGVAALVSELDQHAATLASN